VDTPPVVDTPPTEDTSPVVDTPAVVETSLVHEIMMFAPPMDEELTLDWSKIMSFAEKQLEAEEKSILSKADSKSKTSNSICGGNNSSINNNNNNNEPFSNTRTNEESGEEVKNGTYMSPTSTATTTATTKTTGQEHENSTASSMRHSSSTHETISEGTRSAVCESIRSTRSIVDESVQSSIDISLLESCSYDEEPRLLLTSLIVRFLSRLIQVLKRGGEVDLEEQEVQLAQEVIFPQPEHANEGLVSKAFRYAVFFLIFAFWPAGIPRTMVESSSTPHEKPSLLKLVIEYDEKEAELVYQEP